MENIIENENTKEIEMEIIHIKKKSISVKRKVVATMSRHITCLQYILGFPLEVEVRDGERKNFEDAEKDCQEWGGHLFSPISAKENTDMTNKIRK